MKSEEKITVYITTLIALGVGFLMAAITISSHLSEERMQEMYETCISEGNEPMDCKTSLLN